MSEERDEHRLQQLQQWEAATKKEIEEIAAALAPLERRLQAARERLDLIRRLTRLTESAQQVSQAAGLDVTRETGDTIGSILPKQDLEAHLEHILGETGRPMHISEIRQALVDRAVPLPGRGDEANIIVRLRRAPDRFTRTGRGTYALATLGLEAVPPARRRVKIRRKP